jgi:hypothetical protein
MIYQNIYKSEMLYYFRIHAENCYQYNKKLGLEFIRLSMHTIWDLVYLLHYLFYLINPWALIISGLAHILHLSVKIAWFILPYA